MKKTAFICILLIIASVSTFCACVQKHTDENSTAPDISVLNSADEIKSAFLMESDAVTVTENSVVFTDAVGRSLEIEKFPVSTVSLYSSFTALWYEAGGTVSGCIGGSAARDVYIEHIGRDITLDGGVTVLSTASNSKHWDVESIIASAPSLVLVSTAMDGFSTVDGPAKAAGIPVVCVDYQNFSDYLKWFKVFCNLNGRPELWKEVALPALDKVTDIILSVKKQTPKKVMCMFSGTDSLKANTQNTVVGEMLTHLNAVNIADSTTTAKAERIEINLETVYLADPDIIVVQCHTDPTTAKSIADAVYGNNEVWNSLRAVKNGNVYFLDKELFHNKPNRRFAEAYETLAALLYGYQNTEAVTGLDIEYVSSVASLPNDVKSAIKSGHPVGGNPLYCTFENGLTFFRREWFYDTVSEFRITLPAEWSDGNIIFIGSGAGSGEVHMMIEAVRNGKTEYMECAFYSDFLLDSGDNLVLMYSGFVSPETAEFYLNIQ